MTRIAFDIGGTFTDVVIMDEGGHLATFKLLSFEDIGLDISKLLASRSIDAVDHIHHATTVCSNALIEANTARTALITTTGFRDTLELRGQRGPSTNSLDWLPPAALVPRNLCFEVDERILANGDVYREPDEASAISLIRDIENMGIESIAISLINAYLNADHEVKLGQLCRSCAPELDVCLSSEIHPEVREYERTSTTVINASLIPVVKRYLNRLKHHLAPISDHLVVMQSNGGMMSVEAAIRRPIYMVESGPAAGVVGAARVAQELNLPRVLSFDMGGTTAKACLILEGTPTERIGATVSYGASSAGLSGEEGYALSVPTLDLVEVGAGGGSIAWVDREVLRVGPRSAGALPGPVCYGQGGTMPTVTDANLVLGYMNPSIIADGILDIDQQGAFDAIELLGAPLGLGIMDTAYGIVTVANATMARALKAVSTDRGHDPREHSLICFGGAGPLHAVALAESLEMFTVIVPACSGVLSALGLLLADYRLDVSSAVVSPLSDLSNSVIAAAFVELEATAVREMKSLRMPTDEIRFSRSADMRLGFQLDDLSLPCSGVDEEELVEMLGDLFDATYEREFGHSTKGEAIHLMTVRVRASTRSTAPLSQSLKSDPERLSSDRLVYRDAYFGPTHQMCATPIYTRFSIDGAVTGPAIVEETDSTILVPPGWSVSRHSSNALVIKRHI